MHPRQSESDCPDTEIEGKDDLVRLHEASSDCSDPLADEKSMWRSQSDPYTDDTC